MPPRRYVSKPCYPPVEGLVLRGWAPLVTTIPERANVIGVDGPVMARWPAVVANLSKALKLKGADATFVATSGWYLPWPRVEELTSSPRLRHDPDFEFLAGGTLAELLEVPSPLRSTSGQLLVVWGPGASLCRPDVLWYVDLPKRYAEAAIAAGSGLNLGQPEGSGPGTPKRLFFVDWPLIDRHRDQFAGSIDYWVDVQDPDEPAAVRGSSLLATLERLSSQPFRTRPTFNSTPWGGHWAQEHLGHNEDAPNSALGYELIAPESGILVGSPDGPQVEVPLQLAVALHPEALLGKAITPRFGTSFPLRFDYLDTYGGGNLSVHCHPQHEYMKSVFGWSYTQHETYYVIAARDGTRIFLGLKDGVDIAAFQQAARSADTDGVAMAIDAYVQTFPATPHQLYLVPAGTPHGSGEGNVVLEMSATPYLYSLRFYDWLRRDTYGQHRPVHVDHAFNNLDVKRSGGSVGQELVQQPVKLREGDGWHEELLGSLEEMFFEVRRVVLRPDARSADRTGDRFHVLNVVEGAGVVVGTAKATHELSFAETLVVPAAVGCYWLSPLGPGPVRVVKAMVR